jgi:hypothetical protein
MAGLIEVRCRADEVFGQDTLPAENRRPDQLDKRMRWICRTADEEPLGFEPATAEVEGFLAEKAKGNIKILPPKGQLHCDVDFGALSADEAKMVEERIMRVLSRGTGLG